MRSVYGETTSEFIEKKSRFIGLLFHVEDNETIEEKLAYCKELYPDASHYVYAYILDNNTQKASDDGEPQRTAGYPILDILHKNRLNDVLGVVIRYFGGIKLGAGGLIRAYSHTISESIKKATFIEKVTSYYCKFTTEYDFLGDIDKIIRDKTTLDKVKYDQAISFFFYLNNYNFEKIKSALFNHNGYNDTLEIIEEKEVYAKVID
ncbi:MAG: YigZ family protein [Candidatus Izimaplasma sp.]|nr:YigZ family protein [Candidatus Izimaplasma bacterium]